MRLSGKWAAKQINFSLAMAHGLRLGAATARLLGLRVRIPPSMDECLLWVFVLLGTGFYVGLITNPEDS